ncbi:HEPN domain-containing protein [Candidatus Woesearchaeota archaeon]|nr:HEPN domain-containing protein [Candidatus Woesearchaeota archaeon]
MKSDKRNPKYHVSWCCKQKRGIKLETSNDNLCKAYIQKAKSALNILNSALEKNEIDWIASTAYYSRYFAFYALLQKCGIKSEIHDCTISLMQSIFVEEKIINEELYAELLLAKELRVDLQYYVTEQIDKEKIKKDCSTAGNFVLKMEEVVENISNDQIKKIKERLSKEYLPRNYSKKKSE